MEYIYEASKVKYPGILNLAEHFFVQIWLIIRLISFCINSDLFAFSFFSIQPIENQLMCVRFAEILKRLAGTIFKNFVCILLAWPYKIHFCV